MIQSRYMIVETGFTMINWQTMEKSYLKERYPSVAIKNIKFMTMRTHQPDTDSCGDYAAAFATALALGDDPETI